MTEAQISAGRPQSNRSKTVTARSVLANILRRFAEIGAAARCFTSPRHRDVVQGHEGHAQDADVTTDTITTFSAEAIDNAPEIKAIAPVVPDQEEIERRRNLIRIFFNEFWSGASDKPAAFVKRLDEAEDYLNERLAANGETWRFDATMRVMLGLPPRSKSSVSANI
jgi:hypothetical protein